MTDLERLDKAVRRVPDFPKPGILYYDITGICADPASFRFCVDSAVRIYEDAHVDGVAAIESRGFIFAAPIAVRLGVPLVLIRKKGKLPGDTYKREYSLEYGMASIEAHKSDIQRGKKYLVIDDLIATGGTLSAARDLIEQGGASVMEFFGVIGLPALNYEKALAPASVRVLITYGGE